MQFCTSTYQHLLGYGDGARADVYSASTSPSCCVGGMVPSTSARLIVGGLLHP